MKNIIEGLIEINGAQAIDEVIEFISNEFSPDDVFSKDALETWALNNGFVKED